MAGDNVALLITDERSRQSRCSTPRASARIDAAAWRAMQSAACVLVDGTFWSDDEMLRLGLSRKRARDIGHLAQSGPGGMLEWLGAAARGDAQDPDPHQQHQSHPRRGLARSAPSSARRGVEVAWDGMEIEL